MNFRIRNVALLFLVLVLAAGLASAQGVKVVNSSGNTVANTSSDQNGPAPKAPTGGANNTYKYWDVLGTGGTSTDYFSRPPYITAPPNPQIAVGPDDIITIVNRTIARYPNINAGTSGSNAVGVTNPYNNPPTEFVWLDTWLGLIGNTALQTVCPSGTSNNGICIIDNASVRYDQMQGRFVVLFTVTDIIAHRSNFIVIVSKFSQFTKCTTTQPTCPAASPLFSPPVIAPVVGGTQTGGINTANWFAYVIPINVTYAVRPPTALGNGIVGVPNSVTTGGATVGGFVTTQFCPGGGPSVLTGGAGGTARSCTNYFPTGARMGLDNDNIILTAPVLDSAFSSPAEATGGVLPITPGQNLGPYAGTRVVTLAKIIVYNAGALNLSTQPPVCDTNTPIDCTAVNLADNTVTGTLTAVGQGTFGTGINGNCRGATPAIGTCEATVETLGPESRIGNPIPAVYWEPDNLRGRALASFDAQVAPFGTAAAGVITPIDYLVGRRVYDNFGNPTPTVANGTVSNTQLWIQALVFTCPAGNLLLDPIKFCGSNGSVSADQPFLGNLFTNTSSIALATNPATVGQGFSADQMTTNPLNNPVVSTVDKRLFVGDARPIQVMFREGLLYEARTARIYDLDGNPLGSSTVVYDTIRTCATSAPSPTCGYSVNGLPGNLGTGLAAPFLIMESEWTNGQNVPAATDFAGFGFYAPMFESPANVVSSGPVSPISLFPWLEKLFVGMTTGGTSNVAATFSRNFPSLWDFRPGDDAYDTVQPYINPYTGLSTNTVPCTGAITLAGTATKAAGATTSATTTTILMSNTTSLALGMSLTGFTPVPATQPNIGTITNNNPVITAINPGVSVTVGTGFGWVLGTGPGSSPNLNLTGNFTFSSTPANINATTSSTVGLTAGSNQIVVGTAPPTGVQIGSTVAGRTGITTTTAVFTGATGCPVGNTIPCAGDNTGLPLVAVTSLGNIGAGETIAGTATVTITGSTVTGSTVVAVPAPTANGGYIFAGDTVTGTGIPAGTIVVTGNGTNGTSIVLSAAATATGTVPLTFGSNAIAPSTVLATATQNGTNTLLLSNPLLAPVPAGRTLTLSAAGLIPAGTTVTNFGTNGVIFLSANPNIPAGITLTFSTCPTVPGAICVGNIPLVFGATAASGSCPLIQWSIRGGASTDPNDGSLWLFGQFAKNRLASIPGPGQWGTSVANYALDFPATDAYNNDNSFFGDVAPGNGFFTWIQIAKNLGLAQPTALGPCPTSPAGSPPVVQPPVAGTTPNPSPSTLQCPFFSPTATVTRAEMAYWVIRSQMDDAMVTAFLNATGGDPTANTATYSFGDATPGNIVNPFLGNPGAGFQGVTNTQLARYVEVMVRRGYTKGKGICTVQGTTDAVFRYCPNDLITRGEMAVFLIRAKMNNVFPTSLSGLPAFGPYGDQFGVMQQSPSYFTDVTSASDFYIYIQKMRELRITNGTGATAYSPGNPLTRQEIATFVVRAFFL